MMILYKILVIFFICLSFIYCCCFSVFLFFFSVSFFYKRLFLIWINVSKLMKCRKKCVNFCKISKKKIFYRHMICFFLSSKFFIYVLRRIDWLILFLAVCKFPNIWSWNMSSLSTKFDKLILFYSIYLKVILS